MAIEEAVELGSHGNTNLLPRFKLTNLRTDRYRRKAISLLLIATGIAKYEEEVCVDSIGRRGHTYIEEQRRGYQHQ